MNLDSLRHIILQTAPRVLGQMDRSPGSSTYGCSERYYWKYRLHDYPNARFQETALLLALLHTTPFKGNVYYQNANVAEWSIAACRFWLECRNSDGSCQEMYPRERSFCATSFSTWSVCMALLLLKHGAAGQKVEAFLDKTGFTTSLHASAAWLANHMHFEVSNQAAAAALSLECVAKLTGDASYSNEASRIAAGLLQRNPQGAFQEYGGFDLGYATITSSCLCWYAEMSEPDEQLRPFLEACQSRYDGLLDDQAQFDISGMSRGTGYIYPHLFARYGVSSLGKILAGLQNNTLLSPLWMDDRYCIALASDYVKTLAILSGD